MGLVPYSPITTEHGDLTISWPYPQLFIGSDYRYICELTKVHELSAWTPTLKVTTTGSGIWDFIDFGSYILLVNGAKIVIGVSGSYSTITSSATMPRFATG